MSENHKNTKFHLESHEGFSKPDPDSQDFGISGKLTLLFDP